MTAPIDVTFTTGTTITSEWLNGVNDFVNDPQAISVNYTPPFTGGVTETVSDKLSQTVSVEDFGAVGDGITDDTTAIQNAINALASTGGILNFGPNTYSIKNTTGGYALTATSNIKLQGLAGKSTLQLASVAANSAMFGSSSAITNVEIDGMMFDGNKTTVTTHDTYGVKFENINNLTITNSQFKNLRMDGVLCGLTTLAEDVTVDNCLFTGIGVTGVGANGIRVYHNKGLVINNCRFYGFITSPIDSNPTSGTDAETYANITNNYIYNDSTNWMTGTSSISLLLDRVLCQGNTIIGGGPIVVHDYVGSGQTTRDYRIIGNSILNGVSTGITVNQGENSDIIVSDNIIKGCYGSSIAVINPNTPPYTTTNPVIVSNNIIEDNNSNTSYTHTSQPACILIAQANNVVVEGNQCIGPRFAGVYCAGSSYITVQNNFIINQKGYAASDFTTYNGGGIIVAPGGYAYPASVSNVVVDGNFVYNFLTTLSGSPSANVRVGGITVFNDGSPTYTVSDITITNNVVNQGYGIGIQTYTLTSCYINNNNITNTVGTLVDTSSTYRIANAVIGAYSAAPTTGTWARGTVVYNSAPSSGGYVGWVCTAAGTPGTWKTFGVIS